MQGLHIERITVFVHFSYLKNYFGGCINLVLHVNTGQYSMVSKLLLILTQLLKQAKVLDLNSRHIKMLPTTLIKTPFSRWQLLYQIKY